MRFIRITLLIFMVSLACILPVPLAIKFKDNLPKNLIERVEQNDQEEDTECKELF